jgi:hypothetical protein
MTPVGFVTVPCQTFFSGGEFLHYIDGLRVYPFMPQCTPTVEGFITAMYNGKIFFLLNINLIVWRLGCVWWLFDIQVMLCK